MALPQVYGRAVVLYSALVILFGTAVVLYRPIFSLNRNIEFVRLICHNFKVYREKFLTLNPPVAGFGNSQTVRFGKTLMSFATKSLFSAQLFPGYQVAILIKNSPQIIGVKLLIKITALNQTVISIGL